MLTQRFDTVQIREPVVDKMTGFLHVKRVPIAQVMVQPYIKNDGSIDHEAKLPEELLSDATVQSANNKPVTDNHPGEMVTKDNAKKYMKGFTDSDAYVDGNMLYNDITITDSDLINQIVNGKRELSIGFQADIQPESGDLNGIKYDSVQRNIRINHVAVVNRGRAGHNVRLLGDSAEAIEEGEHMETTQIRLDGANVTVASQDADRIMKLDADNSAKAKKIAEYQAQIKDLQAKIKELQGNSDDAQKSADEAQAKADALEKELADTKKKFTSDSLDKAVAEKVELIDKVKPYVGDSFDFKGKTDRAIKEEAVKSVNDSVDFTDKSDDYVNAIFDYTLSNTKPSSVVGYTGPEYKGDSLSDLKAAAEKARYERYHLAD